MSSSASSNDSNDSKIPPNIAKTIDESNYVKLSSITAAICNATANRQNSSVDKWPTNESDKINELNNKTNILNHLNHVNSVNTQKSVLSMVNQKNINNLNNLLNKSSATTHNCINQANNKINNDLNDAKLSTNTNVDYNKNGLPQPPSPPNVDITKFNGNFSRNSQSYVIQSMGSGVPTTNPVPILNGNVDEKVVAKGKNRLFSLALYLSLSLCHSFTICFA